MDAITADVYYGSPSSLKTGRADDSFEEDWSSFPASARTVSLEELLVDLLNWTPVRSWSRTAVFEDFGAPATGTGIRVAIEAPAPELLRPDAAIATIQAALSLNITETAQILGVERPTVYAWIAGRGNPQRANLDRLNWLRQVAAKWSEHSTMPLGELVRATSVEGVTIVDLLAAAVTPEGELVRRFEQAAATQATGAINGPRHQSAREAADRHGIATPSAEAAGQAHVDWLTRRSLGPED